MEDTLREARLSKTLHLQRLNPCFNGRYSQSFGIIIKHSERRVLILVLMEDTLRVKKSSGRRSKNRLNPCFNGRYSQRRRKRRLKQPYLVLILVLMEDTLREQRLVSLCLSSFDVCLPL